MGKTVGCWVLARQIYFILVKTEGKSMRLLTQTNISSLSVVPPSSQSTFLCVCLTLSLLHAPPSSLSDPLSVCLSLSLSLSLSLTHTSHLSLYPLSFPLSIPLLDYLSVAYTISCTNWCKPFPAPSYPQLSNCAHPVPLLTAPSSVRSSPSLLTLLPYISRRILHLPLLPPLSP